MAHCDFLSFSVIFNISWFRPSDCLRKFFWQLIFIHFAGDSITFSLSSAKSSDFTIHPTSGVVTLNNALNYESLNLYSLTVTASDGNSYGNGSLRSTSLTVTVTNRNDAPVSLSNSYSATIAEDEPGGTNVLKTGASDEDGHGILFSLSGSSDFDILNTGMIRIKTGVTLDYETQDSYNLTVEFSDGTASISKFVSITVLDRNDAPTLPSSPYSTNVSEEVPIGTSVFVASASDQDEDSSVYSLSGAGVTHFIIDSNTGIVTTSQVLNFEESSVCIQKEIFYLKSGTDSLKRSRCKPANYEIYLSPLWIYVMSLKICFNTMVMIINECSKIVILLFYSLFVCCSARHCLRQSIRLDLLTKTGSVREETLRFSINGSTL